MDPQISFTNPIISISKNRHQMQKKKLINFANRQKNTTCCWHQESASIRGFPILPPFTFYYPFGFEKELFLYCFSLSNILHLLTPFCHFLLTHVIQTHTWLGEIEIEILGEGLLGRGSERLFLRAFKVS